MNYHYALKIDGNVRAISMGKASFSETSNMLKSCSLMSNVSYF